MARKSGRSKELKNSMMKPGKQIINQAIEEAREKLKQYQEEEKAAEEMSGGGGGKGGKDKIGGGNILGGLVGNKGNPMAEFLGELGGSALVMAGGFVAGILQGMNESAENFDFNNRYGFASTPKNLNSEEEEVYRNALIEAFGYTAFQVGGWKDWQTAEEYVNNGGFQNGDKGGSILGLLQDGEYYKVR